MSTHALSAGPLDRSDYLHGSALAVQERYGGAGSDRARTRTIEDFQTNRYALRLTEAQAAAFDALRSSYAEFFGEPTTKNGLRPRAIEDE